MTTLLMSGEQRRALLLALATRAARSGLRADTRAAVQHLAWLAAECPAETRDAAWRELVELAGQALPATQAEAVAWSRTLRRIQLVLVPPVAVGEQAWQAVDATVAP